MIDKLTPRFLDKSSDYKLVRKTSLIDALNIYVDTETGGEHTAGVIKPIKGTVSIDPDSANEFADYAYKAIGSVTDENTGIVYFFVWSSNSGEHSIWAYDHRGVLPVYDSESGQYVVGNRRQLLKIVSDFHFNFPVNGFVKGDIVYTNTREFDKYDELKDGVYPQKDALLYLTDNLNEPKKVNVYRAYLTGSNVPDTLSTAEKNQIARDYIYACPRVPLDRISFEFSSDTDRDVNNFATAPGFQFAYQNIYQDGLESALSPYSPIAFPPSIVDRGAAQNDNLLAHNKCELRIPAQNTEVASIKILARQGNSLSFVELDEVENENPGEDIFYSFYNDKIASGVSNQTADKTFDNLPQRAQAQSVVSNRLVYGNYVEGYDNVDCSGVELDPVYIDRPPELLDYVVKISPSIELNQGNSDVLGGNRINVNKCMGFTIDSRQFSDSISANTKIRLSFSISPDKNFHAYTVRATNNNPSIASSYHQSRQVGSFSKNLPGYDADGGGFGGSTAAFFQENVGYGEPAYQEDGAAGGYFLQSKRENYFGNNTGVIGNAFAAWNTVQDHPIGAGSQVGPSAYSNVAFGTSAANPFIIQGGKLSFSAVFNVNVPISSGGRSLISKTLVALLSGKDQTYLDENLGLAPNSVTFNEDDVKRSHIHSVDLGLSDFSPIVPGSDYSNLIVGGGIYGNSNDPLGNLQNQPPQFAFIVNKAQARFDLVESEQRESGQFRAMSVRLAYVNVDPEEGVMTCVRDLDPRSPWWAISKSRMEETITQDDWAEHLQVSQRVYHPTLDWRANFTNHFYTNDGQEFNTIKHIQEHCFGYLNVPFDSNYGAHRLIGGSFFEGTSENYDDFSLLDGEGGPGGSGAGEGTAYDAQGNDQFGSVAGQVFIGVDDSAVEKSKNKQYQKYTLSELPSVATNVALSFVRDNEIADQLELESLENDDAAWKHTSVLMGPFYTGKIVMSNISFADVAELDPVNLHGDQAQLPGINGNPDAFVTTTLPLVFFSSWVKDPEDIHNSDEPPVLKARSNQYYNLDAPDDSLSGEYDNQYPNFPDFNGDHFSQEENGDRQVSYPHPIVLPSTEGGGGIIDGELVSGQTTFLNNSDIYFKSVDFELLQSHGEIVGSSTSSEVEGYTGSLSFKSSATHEIGMVYYDERGRHGRVNKIGSVYIEGYGEREGGRGKAMIKVSNITHTPPPWAKKYKFVYSKNTTYDSFIQYSAGGAFIANSDYDGTNPSNIYVSLNYLQGHPISYSDSFGARGEDGTPVLYSPTPGDRLRVISYMLSETDGNINRIYPIGAEFEVAEVVSLGDTDNPLVAPTDGIEDVPVPEAKKGLFVVLKNNDDASGFRYQSIEQGEDNWGNNCIFEIFSPRKEMDAEDRLYYETGEAYNVVYGASPLPDDNSYGYFHEFDQVILKEGDVFFRRHAVNLRDYSTAEGFVDMLEVADDEELDIRPESNFKSYYLESEAATDLFPSRIVGSGRPNIIDLDARQALREATLVHSDRDVVQSRKIGYSSFNRTIPSDMEIDPRPGPINYLANHQDSLFFVQKNKCGHIPVDRSLLSDTTGSSNIIASSKFLNTPRYYVGEAGCDDNPESVVSVDNTAYFAHKSSGRVFKVSGANGVNVISDKNMSAFIRNAFQDATTSSSNPLMVVGGYDPMKKEYLLSISNSDYADNTSPLPPEETTGIQIGSESVDGEGIESVDFVSDTGLEGFTSDEEATLVPRIDVDWNLPSGLSDASWNIQYGVQTGNAGSPFTPDLNSAASYWGPSGFTTVYNSLGFDAKAVVKINGAKNFNGDQNIELELGVLASAANPFEVGEMVQQDLVTSEASNSSILNNLEEWQGQSLGGELPCGWHFSPEAASASEYLSEATGFPYRMKIDWDPETVEDEIIEIEVPIRFICRGDVEDDYGVIIPEADLGNIHPMSVQYKGGLQITSHHHPLSDATLDPLTASNNVRIVDLFGTVNFSPSEAYASTNVFVDTGDGLEYTFNPCDPVYGFFNLSFGVVELSTVQDWFASPSYQGWIENVLGLNFDELTTEESDAIRDAIVEALDLVFGTELICPNINYKEELVDG